MDYDTMYNAVLGFAQSEGNPEWSYSLLCSLLAGASVGSSNAARNFASQVNATDGLFYYRGDDPADFAARIVSSMTISD